MMMEKKQFWKYKKKRKKAVRDNLEDIKKKILKKKTTKVKKEKCNNLDDNEKEQLRKYEKERISCPW